MVERVRDSNLVVQAKSNLYELAFTGFFNQMEGYSPDFAAEFNKFRSLN